MVSDAVAAIPAPRDGKSVTPEDVQPMIQELVRNAVAEIPTPKDGKDFDPSMLKQLVEQAVSDAVSTMPAAEPGKDGADGRDALALEILPFIDEEKSYPRGSYATHNGGLWRAYEKTHGMRGWECLVDGVAGIDIQQSEQRCFTLKVNRTSGTSETKSFDVPVMIYQAYSNPVRNICLATRLHGAAPCGTATNGRRTSRVRLARKAGRWQLSVAATGGIKRD